MKNKAMLISLPIMALVGLGTGCSNGLSSGTAASATISSAVSYPSSKTDNFRLSLTDAPHPSLSHVIVNVDHIEVLLKKGSDEGRVIMGQNLGQIDLLKLRDGVHLPIKDLNLRSGVEVKQFRSVLKDDGNYIQRLKDGSLCNLKTPSQQQTGLKLIMPGGGFTIEDNQVYSLVVDFDVDHSIVDNKNNCLLKPVLKVKSLTQVPRDNDDGGSSQPPSDSNNGGTTPPSDTSSGGSTPPSDTSSGGSTPPSDTSSGGSTPPSDTSSGGTVGGSTPPSDTSSGGTVGSDPSSGNTSSGSTDSSSGGTVESGGTNTSSGGDTSGGSGTSGDGAPIVGEGNTTFFNL